MALLAGNVGAVKLSTNTVAQIQKWTLSFGPNLQDTAAFGDAWEEKSKALLKWSGSFSGQALAFGDDTNGQDALAGAALAGTTVALRLYESSTKYYSGNAFVEFSGDADESSASQGRTYTFTGTGTLSYT
jgi:hypothetical protein